MRRVRSPSARRVAWRQARATALSSAVCLCAALVLLVAQGVPATRVDFVAVAAVLASLLAMAWLGTRWPVEAP